MQAARIIASAVVLTVASFANAAALETYLPLKEGNIWEYRVFQKILAPAFDDKAIEEIAQNTPGKLLRTIPFFKDFQGKKGAYLKDVRTIPFAEKKIINISLVVDNGDGPFIYARATGIEEKNSEKINELEIAVPYYFYKLPLEEGNTWDATENTSKLMRTWVANIKKVNSTVRVPAGTFKNCVLIENNINIVSKLQQTKNNNDPSKASKVSWSKQHHDIKTWYAKNVGLVKVITMLTIVNQDGTKKIIETTTELTSFCLR